MKSINEIHSQALTNIHANIRELSETVQNVLAGFNTDILRLKTTIANIPTVTNDLQKAIENLKRLPAFKVELPETLFTSLDEIRRLATSGPKAALSDLEISITIRKPSDDSEKKKLNWETIKFFVEIILPFLTAIYFSIQNSADAERQHLQRLEEDKKQTQILNQLWLEESEANDLRRESITLQKEQMKRDEEFQKSVITFICSVSECLESLPREEDEPSPPTP